MKKFIWTALIVVTVLVCLCFAGNTRITFNERKHGVMQMNTVSIELTLEEEREINTGAKMTLETYLTLFCNNSELSLMRNVLSGNVRYDIAYIGMYESPKERDETGYESDVKRGFFLHTVTVSRINPFKLMFDEIQTGTYVKDSFADRIVNGISDENDNVVLEPLSDVFPAFSDIDVKLFELSYEMSEPMWFVSSNAQAQDDIAKQNLCVWTKSAGEDFDENKISYTYYVPNTMGWAISIGVLSVVIVAVLYLIARLKKEEKPAFADYRSLDEYSLNTTLGKETGELSEKKMTELPPDEYQGNGVFSGNGKTYDVFGNECYSAPVSHENTEKSKNDGNDLPDIFGN